MIKTDEIITKCIEVAFKPPRENEVLLEIAEDLHINRLGFGKGELVVQKDGKKMVYYKAENVLLGMIKQGNITTEEVNKRLKALRIVE